MPVYVKNKMVLERSVILNIITLYVKNKKTTQRNYE
jgi:hypothetical protein